MGNVQITVVIGNQTLFSVSAVNAVDAINLVVGQLQLALQHFNAQKQPSPTPTPVALPVQPVPASLAEVKQTLVQPVPASLAEVDAQRRQAAGM